MLSLMLLIVGQSLKAGQENNILNSDIKLKGKINGSGTQLRAGITMCRLDLTLDMKVDLQRVNICRPLPVQWSNSLTTSF